MQHEDSKVRVVMTTVVLFTWCLFQFHYLLNVQDASSVFFWFALIFSVYKLGVAHSYDRAGDANQ